MKWVLLFFCAFFGIILFIIFLLICSTIKLNVAKLNISNIENGIKKKIEKDIQIFIELYLFGRIKILGINLNNHMFMKFKEKANFNIFKYLKRDRKVLKNIKISGIVKQLRAEFKNTNFDLQLGTEQVITTAFVITFISTILSIILKNADENEVRFKIMPLYKYGNSINLHLNCIIKVKVVHIIFVIIYLIKEGKVIKNERTSNRRAYDYSYE